MKYFLIVLLTVIFGWGGKVQVRQSTSQDWVGGLQESGYGTDYRLTLKVKANSEQLQIEDLWVGDQYMKVRVMPDPADPQVKSFKKGSNVTCRAEFTIRPGALEKTPGTAVSRLPKPFNFKGEGLLGYTYKGRKAYVEIAEFKKLERIIYP